MPRGFWDWGVNPNAVSVAPEISSSELAVRLGAVDIYERLGEVVLQDSFDAGFSVGAKSLSGAGASVNLYTGVSRSGSYSAQVITQALANMPSGVNYALTLSQLSRLGIEITFNTPLTDCWISATLTVDDGLQQRLGSVRYRRDTGVLQLYNSSGAWVTVATGLATPLTSKLWSVLKFVIDPGTGYYKRAMFANRVIDISTYPLYTYGTDGVVAVFPAFAVAPNANSAASAYIDNVIVTQNEP